MTQPTTEKKRPARIVLACVLCLALIASLPLTSAFAATTDATTATVTFEAGNLELREAPALVFTTTPISSGTYSIALSSNGSKKVKVADNTGSGDGWELKVSLTDFEADGGKANSLDGAAIEVAGATPSGPTTESALMPTIDSTVTLGCSGTPAATPVTVMAAGTDAGLGDWETEWTTGNTTLELPATCTPTEDTHTATMNWSLVAAP